MTTAFWVWSVWYFLLSGSWNPLDNTLGIFGPSNFVRNFAIVAPLYLTVEALTSSLSMTSSASGRGRIVAMANIITTVVMLLFVVVVRANTAYWGIAPEKITHLNFVIYLSALDVLISVGLALLVSLAQRTFGVSNH